MTIIPRPGKRRMRWVVEYRDSTGTRRYKTCYTEEDAKRFEAEKILEPGGNPLVTVKDVALRWLDVAEAKVRPQSHAQYRKVVEHHVLPTLGDRRVASLKPSDIELLLVQKLRAGLKPKTVSHVQTVIFGILKRAHRDGITRANVAAGVSGELGLRRRAREMQTEIKAFNVEQLKTFIAGAPEKYPHLELAFYTMASTGIRIGEACALEWSDIDFEGTTETHELSGGLELVDGEGRTRRHIRSYTIAIERTMLRTGKLSQTKSAKTRRVDISETLRNRLWQAYQSFLERNMKAGNTLPKLVFTNPDGERLRANSVAAQFKKILDHVELPLHFSPHSLRHTYASLHIQNGTNLTYLKEQLGHSSIQMTYDIYGHWLNRSDSSAARRFEQILSGDS